MNEITRQSVDLLIANGEFNAALAQIRTLFSSNPSLSNAQFVLDRVPKVRANFQTRRVALLRSFTIEPIVPLLRASALLHGVAVTTWVSDFNTHAQELLSPQSGLYSFDPQMVVLALQTRDLVPDIWQRFPDLSPTDVDAILSECLADFRSWFTAFRANSAADLVVHSLQLPVYPAAGILDSQNNDGQTAAILRLNSELRRLAKEFSGVYVLDYDGLAARYGRERWGDERKWLTARMPIVADALNVVAQEYLRFLLPLMGRTCKALVVDLDNTLWGGVIGEDGLHGIRIDSEYPGAAFRQLQRAILDLYNRGILLAICSKNNLADAMEVFEKRSEMLLKPHHFAAMRINWQDKAQNLREIAAELNIGIDSLAFLDDNPVERQRVQTELPDVAVLDLPADPMGYTAVLRACPLFERVTLSKEDRERGQYYAEQRQRQELEQNTGTLEDFLRSLRMEARIEPVNAATQARVAQLTQKTNQFNLTTRRYSEPQIVEMAQSADWEVVSISVLDRFGDNGLVGVAILHYNGSVTEIDTMLLSCRVIGRTVETALLAHLMDLARAHGSRSLEGWFLPTKKNQPAQEFYPAHGFESVEESPEGKRWQVDLQQTQVRCPEWITTVS